MPIPPIRLVAHGLCLVLLTVVSASTAVAHRTSDLRAEAYRLHDAGQYREALPSLDSVLAHKHRDIEAHIKRGNIHLRLNHPARAIADFDRVIRFAPSFPSTYT